MRTHWLHVHCTCYTHVVYSILVFTLCTESHSNHGFWYVLLSYAKGFMKMASWYLWSVLKLSWWVHACMHMCVCVCAILKLSRSKWHNGRCMYAMLKFYKNMTFVRVCAMLNVIGMLVYSGTPLIRITRNMDTLDKQDVVPNTSNVYTVEQDNPKWGSINRTLSQTPMRVHVTMY